MHRPGGAKVVTLPSKPGGGNTNNLTTAFNRILVNALAKSLFLLYARSSRSGVDMRPPRMLNLCRFRTRNLWFFWCRGEGESGIGRGTSFLCFYKAGIVLSPFFFFFFSAAVVFFTETLATRADDTLFFGVCGAWGVYGDL